jgi:hypothetical protein
VTTAASGRITRQSLQIRTVSGRGASSSPSPRCSTTDEGPDGASPQDHGRATTPLSTALYPQTGQSRRPGAQYGVQGRDESVTLMNFDKQVR